MARVGGMFGSYSGSFARTGPHNKTGSAVSSKRGKTGFSPKPGGYGKRRRKKKGR